MANGYCQRGWKLSIPGIGKSMRIRLRAREVRIYTREREQRFSTSSTRVESTFSTCDSSSVSRIHCEDNYLGRSSYHHQQRTRESLFITRTNKPRITTLKFATFFGATSREKESGFGEPDTSQLVIASLQRYIVIVNYGQLGSTKSCSGTLVKDCLSLTWKAALDGNAETRHICYPKLLDTWSRYEGNYHKAAR
ncbi:hypothetical protein Tsp_15180 [Trichinella spiralis]|uniref:hypothetical protein n=1 Tax=Trichinella spiralis TaxID=6334 RepID=UPI0001EFE2AE|nr:hypothetical protein Tsp_15180 [Trichinella spiralis]